MNMYKILLTAGMIISLSAAAAFECNDPLQGPSLNKKLWKTGGLGKVGVDDQGVFIQSGPGEEAASLALKKKVNPNDYYVFSCDLYPRKDQAKGYAVLVSGPGWTILVGGDGHFWFECLGRVVAATASNPLDAWYQVRVENRPGLVRASVSANGKVIATWTGLNGAGLSGSIGFAAVAGTNNPGPRGLRVRNVALSVTDAPVTRDLPDDHHRWVGTAAGWSATPSGQVEVFSAGRDGATCLQAKLAQGGEIRFNFEQPLDIGEVKQIVLGMKTRTMDASYNVQYAMISGNGGFFFIDELNKNGGWDWRDVVIYPDLAGQWNSPERKNIVAFAIRFLWMEKPLDLDLDNFYLRLLKSE